MTEFIKILKELIDIETIGKVSKTKFKNKIMDRIDKLAGEKLI